MVSAGKHSTAAIGGKFTIPPPVIRTMYKNLLRIARQLDTHPIVKVHTPIHNAILRRALGIAKGTSLYIPNSSKYEQCVQAEFRRRRERTAKDMNAAFEAIQLFQKSLDILLKGNTTLLGSAAGALSHPPIPIPNAHRATSSGTLTPPSKCQGGLPSVSSPSTSSVGAPSSPASWVVYQTKPKLAPGTLLISHPLTKAHMDRRVVLLVDVDAHDNLVGLVLDLWYNGSVTKGNTMIPEPLWSHNVQYGGPFHVLLTMPPTAAMSALHCGVLNGMPEEGSTPSPTTLPSEDQQTVPSEEDFRWLFAGKPQSTPAQGPKDSAHLAAHNNIPHRLVIPGTLPLYYTRVEHLSELSEECLGKDRSQVRLFWGFVAWSRANLAQEIAEGVWFPCSVSSDFLVRSALSEQNLETEDSNATDTTTTRTRTDSHSSTNESFLHSQAARETIASHERFPTRQELEHDRGLRKRFTGSTAVPPHLANASLGSVRRDTLWDEIMLALGGEFSRSVEPPRVEDNTVSSSKCTPLSRDDEAAHLFSGEEEEDDEQS